MDVNSSPLAQRKDFSEGSISVRVSDYKRKKGPKEMWEDEDGDLSCWSEAKRQAYDAMETNPNAFYYRHVAPGETKKTGPWDDSEKELFLKAMKMHPPSQGKWGIFAQHIPGRVGYQCRNFYHRLLKSGELEELPETPEPQPSKQKRKQCTKISTEIVTYQDTESESESEDATFEIRESDREDTSPVPEPVNIEPVLKHLERKCRFVLSEPFTIERIASEEPLPEKYICGTIFDRFIVDDYDPTQRDDRDKLQKITIFPLFGPL